MTRNELCTEEWRDVVGYEGYYQVSNLGRVRSVDRVVLTSDNKRVPIKGKNIVGDCHDGRSRVGLRINGNSSKHHVDTLVATAFVDNNDNLPVVVHLDGDITNCNASNLSWGENEIVHLFDESAEEEWRDVVGFEGYYQVSSQGRIKSLSIEIPTGTTSTRTRTERILKQRLNAYGYPQVLLRKDGESKLLRVHRLVAEAFIPNPNNLPVVDHIDARRNNNCVENLRWVTQEENIHHAIELGNLSYEYLHASSLTEEAKKNRMTAISKPVMRSDGKVYQSQIDAARDLGLKSCTSIRNVALGKQDECKGYSFKYI